MYKKREPRWNWRAFLTAEERAILATADRAKAEWLNLNKERASITNRAIQRAKYEAGKATPGARS
ncbi:hypothetical protein [Bradyrhizobium elkanii]|uniref:hypothetical protein n=1 Tax=Bradyrhizobium elkanii TaxID=29448 RepID=UPI00272D69F9|nr:hypothetical protein [Bradyrhizobium elkanii]WLA80314.1 hypothetical protein QNJ99_33755 [Bradyrhizobium elkanii]